MSREGIERKEFLGAVESILQEYIPHQLLQEAKQKRKNVEVKEKDIIQFYMDNSNKKLRMYGTAKELEETLGFYWKIPMVYKLFSVENGSICNIPRTYKNLKGEDFCCKQILVRGYIDTSFYNGLQKITHTERLNECIEFCEFNDELCLGIQKSFLRAFQENSGDLEEVFKRIVADFPTIFLPNSETKDQTATVVVRIFEEEDQKFVMESELFNAINFKNPDEKPLECEDSDGYLRTIDVKEVFSTYRDRISGIDFIRFPIIRTRHTSFPIPTPSGDFCILASGVLYDILYRLTFVLNVFQKVKRNSWQMVVKYISILDKYFPPDMKYMYFINLTLVKKLREETDEFWNSLDQKPAKAVRDVGHEGFTPEDVKKELKYLGITDIFSEVASHAKTYCSLAKSLKTTSDMFSLLDKCQFVCIYDRFPSIRNFLHYQKQCGEMHEDNCEICNEKKLENKGKIDEMGENFKKQDKEKIHVANSKSINKKKENQEKKKSVLEEKEKPLIEIQKEVKKKILEESAKKADALEKEIQKEVTKKTMESEDSLAAPEVSRSSESSDDTPGAPEATTSEESPDAKSSSDTILETILESQNAKDASEDFEKALESVNPIVLKDFITELVQADATDEDEEPEDSKATLESPNPEPETKETPSKKTEMCADCKNLLTLQMAEMMSVFMNSASENLDSDDDKEEEEKPEIVTENVEKKALDKSEKEKEKLQKMCYELERKLKETQEEMEKYKKKSSEILEKKKEEIQKMKDSKKKDEEEIKMNHEKILNEKYLLLEQNQREMNDLEENLKKMKHDKEKIHVAHSKMIHKKEEDLEKLEKEKNVLEEKAKKTDDLEKNLKEIQKDMTKKHEEIDKMKKANLKMMKGKDEEMEKLKKHQSQEIKEKKKEVDHLKVDNMHFSNENQNLKMIINQKEEEEEKIRQENIELTENHRLLERNLSHFEMKTAIKLKLLGDEILEKDRIIKDLQGSSLPTTSVYSESSTSSETPSANAFKLKDLLNKRNALDIDSLLEEALEMKNRLISISNQPEIHKMANEEYQKYEEGLKKYQRAIEMNIQLLEGTENVGFAIPIPEFPSLSARFTGEHRAAVEHQIIENRMRTFWS